MADVFTKAKRREVMSRIRGHGNKETEVAFAKLLRTAHITGWRRKQKLFGKPDFVFRRARLAVFVDGCFWHSCPIPKHASCPKTRRAWWANKLKRNQERDREVNRTLRRMGWRVLRVWEHELKHPGPVIARVRRALASSGKADRMATADRLQ